MINAGFNPLQQMAEKTGKSITQLKDEMSKGAISAEMVQQAFIDATSAGGKFYQMSENASKTINGQLSMMQDAMDAAFNEMGQKSEGFIMSGIQMTTTLIENYETVGKVLAGLVATYGTYKTALITNIALTKSWAVAARTDAVAKGIQTAATKALTVAQLALNTAMKANPYVLLITTVAALGTAMWALRDSTSAAEKAETSLNNTMTALEESQEKYNNQIKEAINIATDDASATKDRKDAMDLLINRYPSIIQNYIDEKGHLRDILQLKQEIAIADGKKQREETTETLRKTGLDAWNNYKMADIFYKKQLHAKSFSDYEKKRLKELRDAYEKSSGNSGTWASLREIREYFKAFAANAKKKYARNLTENKIDQFSQGLGDMGIDELKSLQKELERANKNRKARTSVFVKSVGDYLTEADRENLLTKVSGIVSARTKSTYKQDLDKAKKDWEDAKKELAKIENDKSKFTSNQYKDAKERKDTAEKAYKDLGGITSTSSKSHTGETTKKDNRIEAENKASEKLLKLQQGNRQAQLDLEDDTTERKLKLIDLSYDKQKAEIEKKERELAEQNKKAGTTGLNEKGLTVEQQTEINKANEINEKSREKQIFDIYKAELQSMRDYLKEYGTYQQKKLAIAEEYAEKIAKAQTVGEKASLTMEQDNKLKELEKSEFENSVDWTGIFSELKGHTKGYLENLRDQLQSVIREGTLPPDQLATVQEKLREINEAISEQSGAFSFIGDKAREHARLINEAADAQKRLTSAQEKEATSKKNVDDIIEQIRLRLGEGGLENVDIDDNLLSQLSPLSDEFKVMSGLLVDLRVAEGKLADARRKTEKATKEAENAEDASKRASAQAMADWFADAQQFISEKGIDQLPELFNSLGMGGIGNKLSSGLSGFNSAAGAAADFATGNYIGALTKGISAIKSFGSALGIGGGNAAEVAETINRLTDRNELLTIAIEDLTDEMKSAKGASAIDASERARELQKETNENYKEMAQAQAGYHSAHRSFNYYWGGYSQEQIDRLSQQIGRKWSGDLWDLSPEEMKILRTNVDMWEQIQKTGKGGYGGRVADKLNDYIDQAGKLEEITDALYENLTTTTSENVFDDFLNSLYELADGSEDVMDNIAENWQKMVNRMVVNNLVGAKFQQDLENWYERLAKLNESRTKGDITDDEYRKELEELRADYEDKVNSAKNDLESLRESGIIKETSDMDKQEASGKGFQTMSQDTGEELNGRFTALQIAGEEIKTQNVIQSQSLNILTMRADDILSVQTETRNIANDMRNIIADSYLELVQISENTGNSAKYLKDIKADIVEVKRNTSRL